MSALTTRDRLTRALHKHVCGDEWDEWNNPCAWAGEDWDYDKGPAACAYVGEVGLEDAVFAWVATLADDDALLVDICHRQGLSESDGLIWEERGIAVASTFRDLAAVLSERSSR